MRRNLIAVALVLLMISLTLSGCGEKPAETPPPPEAITAPAEPLPPEEPEPEPYTIIDPTVVAYPELAFDGDRMEEGIDDYMVTVGEFNKILNSLYERDYILVDIGDVWREDISEAGEPVMVRNTLYLPEGKKPLIFSYDDTNYYPYMLENGFTYKLILGEDGTRTSPPSGPRPA